MNQNYYPIDFEAQYEETSEKMLEITNKYKDKIRNIKPCPLQALEQQQEDLKLRIDDFGLHFKKQSIYSQFASGQVMAEKRKQPPEMCPECGEELKKQIQCQFCAEIFCPKCCCRKRVIPFLSKDIRLCCQQCHWKFVKLFDNKNFYEQKEKLANVIHFVKNKIAKIAEKVTIKNEEVEEYKKKNRDEKIKEKAIDNKILQQQKKLKQIEEEFRRKVAEKAQRMQEEERRRRRQQEQRQKAREAEAQRQRLEELQRMKEQERIKKAIKEQEQKGKVECQKKTQQQKDMLEKLRKKEEQLKRREEQLLRREEQIKKQPQSNDVTSVNSSNSAARLDNPQQSIGKNSSQRQKIVDTLDSKSAVRSRKGSNEQTKKPYSIQSAENLVRTEPRKSTAENPNKNKYTIKQQKQLNVSEEPADSLQRSLVNMFKPRKQEDSKSLYSNASRNSKSILDMSVNQLLAVRIPVARANPKYEPQEKPTPPLIEIKVEEEQQEVVINPKIYQARRPTITQEEEKLKDQQVKMHKQSILKNSSLITNKQTVQEELAPQKCSCQIM